MEHGENSEKIDGCSEAGVPDLNSDCLESIFNYLCFRDLCSVARTCRRYAEVAQASFHGAHKGTVILTPSECDVEGIEVFAADVKNLQLMESLWGLLFSIGYDYPDDTNEFTDIKFEKLVQQLDQNFPKIKTLVLCVSRPQYFLESKLFARIAPQITYFALASHTIHSGVDKEIKHWSKLSNVQAIDFIDTHYKRQYFNALMRMEFPHLQSFQFGLMHFLDETKLCPFLKRHSRLKVLKIIVPYIPRMEYLMSVEVLPSLESLSLHLPMIYTYGSIELFTLIISENELHELFRLLEHGRFPPHSASGARQLAHQLKSYYTPSTSIKSNISKLNGCSFAVFYSRSSDWTDGLLELVEMLPNLVAIKDDTKTQWNDHIYLAFVSACKRANRNKKLILRVHADKFNVSNSLLEEHCKYVDFDLESLKYVGLLPYRDMRRCTSSE